MAALGRAGRGQGGGGGGGAPARLVALSAALAAGGVEAVGEALLERGMVATGAIAGVVVVLVDDDTLELVAASGYGEEELAAWRRLPLDAPLPVAEAVATRRPVVVGSLEELHRRYPQVVTRGHEARALAAYPLLDGERVLGAVGLRFDLDGAPPDDGLPVDLAGPRAVVPALLERIGQLQGALDSRIAIEQAKGVLAERHGLPVDKAFERLRTTARSSGRRIQDVAADIVAGRLDG